MSSCTRCSGLTRRRARKAAGFTMVELMLALGITGLIAAAVAAMMTTVSYGATEARDARALVAKSKALQARITAAIRTGVLILDANTAADDGDDFVILWRPGPEAAPNTPRTSELQRIAFDTATGRIVSYRNPAPASDTTYTLADDFAATTATLITNGTLPAEVWATGVADWDVTLNDDEPQNATIASYRASLSSGAITEVAIGAAALRNRSIQTGE